jgi:hypothetical protein
LGFIALIIGVLVWIFTPESVRWLTPKGRFAEARTKVARHLGLPLDSVAFADNGAGHATVRQSVRPMVAATHVLGDHPDLGWFLDAAYGVYLWGLPDIVVHSARHGVRARRPR